MRIVLHGTLATAFGRDHTICTDVPADAIEGLSRQLVGWPRDLVIDVIDFATEEALHSTTEVAEIHLMPRMFGGGGKWGQILIGAALIGLSFVPGLQGVTIPLLMTSLHGMMFAMGVSMLLAGVAQVFMKAPTTNKSNDPAASKYLGVNKNTTEAGTLIGNAWGRIRISGHWLSLQSNSDNIITASFPVNPT